MNFSLTIVQPVSARVRTGSERYCGFVGVAERMSDIIASVGGAREIADLLARQCRRRRDGEDSGEGEQPREGRTAGGGDWFSGSVRHFMPPQIIEQRALQAHRGRITTLFLA